MREWINLVENLGEYADLYWFWYHPKEGRLHHVDGTHTDSAYYELGFKPRELRPDELENGIDLDDDEIIATAIAAGWVRGRYGYKKKADQTLLWRSTDDGGSDPKADLSLQGDPKGVWKTATALSKKWAYSTLYVDFNNDHDSMDGKSSHKLTGERLEFYLKRGTVPSEMVRESDKLHR